MAKPANPAPAPLKADAPAPKAGLSQELQTAIQTVAHFCDQAPVAGPAHRSWQQALDTIAKALVAAAAKG